RILMTKMNEVELASNTVAEAPSAGKISPGRREFIGWTVAAAASSVVIPGFLVKKVGAQTVCVPVSGEELKAVGAILRGGDGILQATMKLQEETRQTIYYAGGIFQCEPHLLRTYHGYRGFS